MDSSNSAIYEPNQNAELVEHRSQEVIKTKNDLFNQLQATNERGLQSQKKSVSFVNRLIIKSDSQWKAVFDLVMLFASCENTFSQAFQAAFGTFESEYINNLEIYFIEGLFLFDLIFCFFQEFKDEETYTIISDVKKIAKHYLRGSFIFDLLAIIPI